MAGAHEISRTSPPPAFAPPSATWSRSDPCVENLEMKTKAVLSDSSRHRQEIARKMFVLMASAGLRYEFFIFKTVTPDAP
jgi:hypothetical protein